MGGMRHSRLRGTTALVAALLLLVQMVFGAGVCLAKVRALTGGTDAASPYGVICTLYGTPQPASGDGRQPPENAPSGAAQGDCPICLGFGSVIPATVIEIPGAPPGSVVFAPAPALFRAGISLSGYRNRGPPPSLSI